MSEEKANKGRVKSEGNEEIRRPLVAFRIGGSGDDEGFGLLKEAASVQGTKPFDWFLNEDALHLVYVCKNEDARSRLHKVLRKTDSHGEWIERDGQKINWS